MEREEADLVAVLDRGEGQQRTELDRGLELAAPARAELLRGRDIDEQHHGELALLDESLDVRLAGARGDVPVDRADVVAGDVRTHLVELHAAPFEHGEIRTRHHVGDLPTGDELDALDGLRDLSGEHDYGTGMFSRIWAIT